MSVCKQEVEPKRGMCFELFIETDYCATNAALRNARGICPVLSVTRLYTKEHTFLAVFLLLCSTIVVLERGTKNLTLYTNGDAKK